VVGGHDLVGQLCAACMALAGCTSFPGSVLGSEIGVD